MVKPRHKKALLNGLIVVMTTTVMLLMLEGLLRVAWQHPYFDNVTLYEKHPYYKHRPIPDISAEVAYPEFTYHTTHTAQGFRGAEVFDPAKAKRRVLFLGDSFVYGDGVNTDETFAARVDQHFPEIEVINSGAAAYETRSELAVLDALGPVFRPDVVFLCVFWNDLEGNLLNDFPDYGFDEKGDCIRLDSMQGMDL